MTTRRDALKLGALAATPVAALMPAAASARDESAERLARLEDEQAITALVTAFVRRFNGNGDCGEFVASAGAIQIDPQVCRIIEDHSADPQLAIEGRSASWMRRTQVDLLTDLEGDTTVERMARFQGQGSAQHSATRRLEAQFARTNDGWAITHLILA